MRTEPAARRDRGPAARRAATGPLWDPRPPCDDAVACWSMGGGLPGRQVCLPGCDALDDGPTAPASGADPGG
ncbi:hypothetical protein [Streptomyces sp. NPDC127098]|uniref:hypothetical protein n=1 Tax=Streptomyces sp. NPDC127098 TaxID=3347137 RepID=UPI003653DB8A